jgi:hypothetical protein
MTDQIFCIWQILKKREYDGTVHHAFIDFKEANDAVGGKYYTVFSLGLEYPGN